MRARVVTICYRKVVGTVITTKNTNHTKKENCVFVFFVRFVVEEDLLR